MAEGQNDVDFLDPLFSIRLPWYRAVDRGSPLSAADWKRWGVGIGQQYMGGCASGG